jgi:choline dehydrogenase-like flavoprotein
MGLLPNQPNIELWNTELYGGPKQYADFPVNGQHAFAMGALLFNQHSRGSVKLKSADALDNPIVDHNYLNDPLDMLVLTEACRFANEIVMKGKGTKDIIKGSWPEDLTHHTYTAREDWEPHVRQHATTCEPLPCPHPLSLAYLYIALRTNVHRLPRIRHLCDG